MKLNADILKQELAKQYRVTMSGSFESRLTLLRPEFYMDGEDSFLTDHLYLATVEHLPRRPKIQRGAVLVCIGDAVNLRYYEERLCLITIHNKADFFKVYQYIQEIYSRYDEWERTLYRDLLQDNSIPAMVRDSYAVFGKPVVVLDSSFHYLASAGIDLQRSEWTASEKGALGTDSLTEFMRTSDLMTEKHGALRIDIKGNRTLSVNLFDKHALYAGCLSVSLGEEEFSTGTDRLAEFLAGMLETAIEKSPSALGDEKPSLKSVMRTLIDEQPISQAQRLILNGVNQKTSYVCAILRYGNKKNRIPAGYICDSLEEAVEGLIAFENEDAIICFMKPEAATENSAFARLAASMNLQAGISSGFDDLFDIRIHYTQALCALENGRLMNPGKTLYSFDEYALSEMILNALGDLPASAYFPPGLAEIIRHDDSSGVSYLETLKVFLEENLSYTSAARRLYIHRSTLIDRIARIEKDLHISLKDPDQRLRIQIVLKAVEIEKMLRDK